MKGIIFAGCSFTWGQGLYFYSDLPNVIPQADNDFHPSKVTDAHIKYKDTLRYPRLVANHLDTFEVTKKSNGGNDKMSIHFVNNLFKEGSDEGRYYVEEIDCIIFQTSQIIRNGFEFIYNNTRYNIKESHSNKPFTNWLIQENLTYDEWFLSFCQQIFDDIKNFFIFYEEKGIKTRILNWQNDLVPYILKDKFMNDRHIKLKYTSQEYNSIDDLVKHNDHMLISNNYLNFANPNNDTHPSKLCHEVIANSIINNIKNN